MKSNRMRKGEISTKKGWNVHTQNKAMYTFDDKSQSKRKKRKTQIT